MDSEDDNLLLSIPAPPANPSIVMTTLATRPIVRDSELRPGRILNSKRPSNMEAWLGQLTGVENATPCVHCRNKAGLWSLCISVESHFGGSCTNCHYNGMGTRCSLRKSSKARLASTTAAVKKASNPNSPLALVTSPAPQRRYSGRRNISIKRFPIPQSVSSRPVPVTAPSSTAALDSGPTLRPRAPPRILPLVSSTRDARNVRQKAQKTLSDRHGAVRHPRRSHTERLRAIASHHVALAELYEEEASMLEEDLDME